MSDVNNVVEDNKEDSTIDKPVENKINHTDRLNEIVLKLDALSKGSDVVSTYKDFKELTEEWEELFKNSNPKLPELENQFWEITHLFTQNYEWALWANFKIKEEICDALDLLLNQSESHELIVKFDELKTKWKDTGNVPSEKSKTLNARYKEVTTKINDKIQGLYDKIEKQKEKNFRIKQALCEKIESLANPGNWKEAEEFVKEAQKNWNVLGPVPQNESDIIWQRFQNSCNNFFTNLKNYYKDLKKHQKDNLRLKKELCDKAEAIKESTDWKETSFKIKSLQEEWKKIGPANKKQEKIIWARFKAACDDFFEKQKSYFEKLEEGKPINLLKKEELCKRLENLHDIDDEEKYNIILKTQAEWKEIGPVQKEKEQAIWHRFRKPIDEFFEKRKEKFEGEKHKQDEILKRKEELCQKAEELSKSNNWQITKEELKELQKQWNELGKVHKELEKELWHRFKTACDSFFDQLKSQKEKTSQTINDNLKKKLDLCFEAEIIAEIEPKTKEEEEARAKWQLEKLTENFWYKVIDEDEDDWASKSNKIKELQREWKEIGPIPREKSQELWERFQQACNAFFQNRKR